MCKTIVNFKKSRAKMSLVLDKLHPCTALKWLIMYCCLTNQIAEFTSVHKHNSTKSGENLAYSSRGESGLQRFLVRHTFRVALRLPKVYIYAFRLMNGKTAFSRSKTSKRIRSQPSRLSVAILMLLRTGPLSTYSWH